MTVAAAAFAAGMMTFAANAQEAPPLAKADTAKQTMDKKHEKAKPAKSITVSIGPEFQTYPVGPIAGLEKEVDKMMTGSITGRVKPDLKATARKEEKNAGATASTRKRPKGARASAAAGGRQKQARAAGAGPEKAAGAMVPADNQDREAVAAILAAKRENQAANGPFHAIITRYASSYGVPVSLAHAVISVESNYRVDARGSAGEVGLMQIKPATARMMGYSGSADGLFDPETNIKYGMKYLGLAHQLGGGATCQTILKYNAGHAARRMNPVSAAYCSKVKLQLGGS